MRLPRLTFPERASIYHVIVRTTAGDFLLDEVDKAMLRAMLERTAAFCGVQVHAFVFLSNHFHLLVRVPPETERGSLDTDTLLARIGRLYGDHVRRDLSAALRSENAAEASLARQELERCRHLMCDLSSFMKLYKMRFTRWYNRRHERFGTLWAERFRSLIVQDHPRSLQAIAAYIDLNPVRAGLCDDPKDYRYCSYSEAVAKDGFARQGLAAILAEPTIQPPCTWRDLHARYRLLIYEKVAVTDMESASGTVPTEKDRKGKSGVSAAKVREVRSAGGHLSVATVLRQRIRHFSKGIALGEKNFIESIFNRHRDLFSAGRKDGARPLRGKVGKCLTDQRCLRDLR